MLLTLVLSLLYACRGRWTKTSCETGGSGSQIMTRTWALNEIPSREKSSKWLAPHSPNTRPASACFALTMHLIVMWLCLRAGSYGIFGALDRRMGHAVLTCSWTLMGLWGRTTPDTYWLKLQTVPWQPYNLGYALAFSQILFARVEKLSHQATHST